MFLTKRTTSTRGPPSCDRCCELRCVVLPVPLLRFGGIFSSSVLGNPGGPGTDAGTPPPNGSTPCRKTLVVDPLREALSGLDAPTAHGCAELPTQR